MFAASYTRGMQYVQQVAEVLAALSTLATVLAHFPGMPARSAAFFARFGVATSKFHVEVK